MKVVCCVCRKVKEDAGWIEKALGNESHLSHGLCPDCYEVVIMRTEQLFTEKKMAKKPG